MVNSLRSSASEQMKQGLFDYLNLNRHKFNERAEFIGEADTRDFVPLWYVGQPYLEAELEGADSESLNNDDESNEDGDILPPFAATRKRRRYSTLTCMRKLDAERARCWEKWGLDTQYPVWMYGGCMDRAKQRSLHCTELGDYRKGIDVWDWKDMDMKDPSTTTVPAQNQPGRQVPKQESKNEDGGNVPVIAPPMVPQSDLNAPTRAQQLLQPSVTARPQYDWYGRAKAERLWQPRVEGSIPANDNFLGGKTQIFSRRPRGPMIRVTPGMGFGGGVGGGGGKPRFLPRFPGDSVSGKPTVIY